MKKLLFLKGKSYRRAIVLLGVYALQLMFFQALMQAQPSYNIDNSFKTLFTSNQTKHSNHSVPAAKHPAVTCYTMLAKQGNDVGGSCDHVTPAVNQMEAVVTPSFLSVTSHVYHTCVVKLHMADDTFKLYRLIQAFLI